MKKLILLSALLISFNGWAQYFTYDGNDYYECTSNAADYSNNDEEYSQYLSTCRLIDYQPIKENKRRIEAERKETEERLLKEQSEINERIIAELRERCVSYGFTGDNNIAACVQREAQHQLELAKLETESRERIKLVQQQSSNQSSQTQRQSNAQQQADAKRQREAQALINLGAVISGAGTPRRTNPKAPITTYPNSFSSTLTVPSNQVCPILSTPITKQEVRGTKRICYYQ